MVTEGCRFDLNSTVTYKGMELEAFIGKATRVRNRLQYGGPGTLGKQGDGKQGDLTVGISLYWDTLYGNLYLIPIFHVQNYI